MRLRRRWPLWGLMAAIALAAVLLVTFKSFWPGWLARYRDWQANRPIHAQLERSIPLNFPAGVPLSALQAAVKQATRCPELPAGIPIYVDPQGMQEMGATAASVVISNLGNVPLRQSLRAALQQIKLDYFVRNGNLFIVNPADVPEGFWAIEDPEDASRPFAASKPRWRRLVHRSWFSRPLFFPTVILSFVAGNAFDLVGTYLYQPHFEHEANPLYVALAPYGLRLSWPLVILCKTLVCLITASGLYFFLVRRRSYYPPHPGSFRELIMQVVYGRPLGWVESCFKLPRSLTPTLLISAAVVSLGGPYYAYLGYGNLAAKYGWWRLGGFWMGRYWIDQALFPWSTLATAWFCWQLWLDFRDRDAGETKPSGGDSLVLSG